MNDGRLRILSHTPPGNERGGNDDEADTNQEGDDHNGSFGGKICQNKTAVHSERPFCLV